MPLIQVFQPGGGGGGAAGVAPGPGTAIADERVVRGDTAGIQGSTLTLQDDASMIFPNGGNIQNAAFVRCGNSDFMVALNRGVGTLDLGIALANNRSIAVSSATTSESGFDTELYRGGVSTWQVGNAGGGLGFIQVGRVVEASTAGSGAPNVLTALGSRTLTTNEGAGVEAYNTLPSGAPIGYERWFSCQSTAGIRVVAPIGNVIAAGPGAVSTAGGYIRSVVAESTIGIIKISATKWTQIAISGTWTAG